jgi:uncharacterized membrane protein
MPDVHIPAAILPGSPPPSRLAILPRVLLITLVLTGLTFAVSLFVGILGMLAWGLLHGHLPDMRLAYRHFALPIAATVGTAAFIAAWIMEVRHYQQAKVLAKIVLANNDRQPSR